MRSGHRHLLKAQIVLQGSMPELQQATGGCRSFFPSLPVKAMLLHSKGFARGQPQLWGGTSSLPVATTHIMFWGGGRRFSFDSHHAQQKFVKEKMRFETLSGLGSRLIPLEGGGEPSRSEFMETHSRQDWECYNK